jgi:rhodanese-related sulfurtransferase
MKRNIKVIGSIAALAFLLTGCGSTSGTNSKVGAADFSAKTQEAGVVTIDVRTAGEYMTGHIQGAINIDVEGMQFNSEIAKLDKSVTYTVYCHSGRRSGIATAAMAKAGFTSLFDLDGGIGAWNAAGLPLVTQ